MQMSYFKTSSKAAETPFEKILFENALSNRVSVYLHPVVSRKNPVGGESIPIIVSIANLPKRLVNKKGSLTDEDLFEIFKYANAGTCNSPYPMKISDTNPPLDFQVDGRYVYRPNHNGTHSARQVRYLEALFDLIEKKGNKEVQTALNELTGEEKFNLKLGAYFLRVGRVDESDHRTPFPDNYARRSAQIYEQYAKQLGVRSEVIDWVKMLIENSCKAPSHHVSSTKNKLGYMLLIMVHEIDLVRCYGKKFFNTKLSLIRNYLNYFVNNNISSRDKDVLRDKLVTLGQDLCRATGEHLAYGRAKEEHLAYSREERDRKRFAWNSWNGADCWKTLQKMPIPKW